MFRGVSPVLEDVLRVVVLADTHLRRDWPNRDLPAQVWELVQGADVILHAGDVLEPEHLEELCEHAPVHAVLGNNDRELAGDLPETLEIELAGVRVGMVHDSGPARGREQRLHDLFPEADVVVFGHSHIPWNQRGVDGQLLFNPGSPTERRRQPHRTAGILQLDDGRRVRAAAHDLGPGAVAEGRAEARGTRDAYGRRPPCRHRARELNMRGRALRRVELQRPALASA